MHILGRPLVAVSIIAIALISNATASPWEEIQAPMAMPAEPVGNYSNGCLIGGKQLPTEGPGYQSVRLFRKRNFGHPLLVNFLQDLGQRVEKRQLGVMLIADMAMPQGGRFSSGHRSHQTGLDADIWLRLDAPRLPRSKRHGMNDVKAILMVDRKKFRVNKHWSFQQEHMIREAARDPRLARIFVHPAIKAELCAVDWQDRSWLRKVRPWWGHDSHFHVRLKCPVGAQDCVDQKPPPPGDGCGKELRSWYPKKVKKPKKPKKPVKKKPYVPPPPPARCQALLDLAVH